MGRQAASDAGQAPDLVRMRQRLDDWRGAHNPGVAFPPKLWLAAGRVARRHGVNVTARALNLEYNKLKRISGGLIAPVARKAKVPSTLKPVKFIELTGALPVSPPSCRIWLQNASGHRLQLEMAPSAATEMVLQLCRSGWSASA